MDKCCVVRLRHGRAIGEVRAQKSVEHSTGIRSLLGASGINGSGYPRLVSGDRWEIVDTCNSKPLSNYKFGSEKSGVGSRHLARANS